MFLGHWIFHKQKFFYWTKLTECLVQYLSWARNCFCRVVLWITKILPAHMISQSGKMLILAAWMVGRCIWWTGSWAKQLVRRDRTHCLPWLVHWVAGKGTGQPASSSTAACVFSSSQVWGRRCEYYIRYWYVCMSTSDYVILSPTDFQWLRYHPSTSSPSAPLPACLPACIYLFLSTTVYFILNFPCLIMFQSLCRLSEVHTILCLTSFMICNHNFNLIITFISAFACAYRDSWYSTYNLIGCFL